MSKQERRFLKEPIAVSTSDTGKKQIKGYAARFSPVRSQDLGGFVETILPTAFDKCLATNPDIRALWNHSPDYVLGRTVAGTLELSVDEAGLKYTIDPPDTQVARDLMVSLGRKDVDQASFAFCAVKDSWKEEKDGTILRTLEEVDCFDISPVTYGAYLDATSQVRSLFPDAKGEVPEEITTKITETRAAHKAEKRYRKVLSAVAGTKWAILPEKLETICALLAARSEGKSATKEEIQAALELRHQDAPVASGNVAVIPVYGVISQRMSAFDDISGGTSCEAISGAFKTALADPAVTSIVFDIDSPGGTVTGVPELAAEILAARGQKPIIAVANGMAASAAYWIASACDKLVVIPSGEVGSIGVYMTHQDVSAAMDKEGVKMTFIQAGKYKTDGNPYEALSDSARADMQDGVDKFYDMFTAGVAAGRGVSQGTVKADFGQGRMLLAKDAVAIGMADEVATLEEVITNLTTVDTPLEVAGSTSNNAAASAVVDTVAGTAVASNSNGCDCNCPECQNDDCGNCSNPDCDDPDCEGCPNQGDDGSEEMKAKAAVEDSVHATTYRRLKLKLASLF
jgi:capsid assembly protease